MSWSYLCFSLVLQMVCKITWISITNLLCHIHIIVISVNAIDCYECAICDDADDATQKSCSSSLFDSCYKFTICKSYVDRLPSVIHIHSASLIFFQIAAGGAEVTERGCYKDVGNAFSDGECKEQSYEGVSDTLCVCDSNLCNGVERMLPHLAMFLMTTLLAYYVM